MPDDLAVISSMISEHEGIRGHMKLVGEAVRGWEAALNPGAGRPIPEQLQALATKRWNLQQTMSYLDEGLKLHYTHEEKVLPPFLGSLLMEALIMEHREIRERIEQVRSSLAGARLDGLSSQELQAGGSAIKQAVEAICQLVESHSLKEDAMIRLLTKVLVAKSKRGAGAPQT